MSISDCEHLCVKCYIANFSIQLSVFSFWSSHSWSARRFVSKLIGKCNCFICIIVRKSDYHLKMYLKIMNYGKKGRNREREHSFIVATLPRWPQWLTLGQARARSLLLFESTQFAEDQTIASSCIAFPSTLASSWIINEAAWAQISTHTDAVVAGSTSISYHNTGCLKFSCV